MEEPGVETNQVPSPGSSADAPRTKSSRATRYPRGGGPYDDERRPTFGQWLKLIWPDILTMLAIGAVVFPVYYFAPPLATPSFPIDDDDEDKKPSTSTRSSSILPQYAYPARPQTISNWLIAIIAIATPVIIILLTQIRIRNFWDLNNALLGFAHALVLSSAFQATVKGLIGGLRPNFYDVCQPDPTKLSDHNKKSGLEGVGYRGDMYTRAACTTPRQASLRNAMQSFPSGHSTTTFAAAIYLSLYLNSKLKVFGNYHTSLWRLVVVLLPILAAVLLVGTLIVDNTHSWWDVLAGATIGTVMALAGYRLVYAGLFNWRVNHIPLSRSVPFVQEEKEDGVSRPGFAEKERATEQMVGDAGQRQRHD
ncbi:PAP2 superfamily-domain-containing protein [Poronia punctata]|nr:PAP2 superfamily-domain-containing protein [Poronia punctata]